MQCNLLDKVTWNKSDNSIVFPNGNILEFFSADRIEKALGARRYMLYANEVNTLKYDVFEELARRSEKIIMDFNPTAQFWLEDKFLPYYEPHKIITSNYKDNVCPPETEVQRIKKRAELDPNFKRIHIDCEYGVYDGLIFPNITLIDKMPELPTSFGLDFGYTNDETALIEVAEDGAGFYLNQLIYQKGLQNSTIAEMCKAKEVRGAIYADSANPKDIDDLYMRGLNVQGVIGGKKEIMYGIGLMKEKPIFVTKSSLHLIKEFRSYMYAIDKQGNKMNYPVDAFNHGIDATRYNIVSRRELQRGFRPLVRTYNDVI
jgi:phage terminase large subunit